jgi:hypothetical protein
MAEKINFSRVTSSRLKYWINSSALEVNTRLITTAQVPDLKLEVFNSRDTRTPGNIMIPLEDVPAVIQALTREYEANKHLIPERPNRYAEEM